MIVAADGQPDAAFQSAPLEHISAICRGHALAEAMHAYAPPDPGLIWTFCCHALTSKIIIKTPNSGFAAGVFRDGGELYPREVIRSKEISLEMY
jgi:hypothetical protein